MSSKDQICHIKSDGWSILCINDHSNFFYLSTKSIVLNNYKKIKSCLIPADSSGFMRYIFFFKDIFMKRYQFSTTCNSIRVMKISFSHD